MARPDVLAAPSRLLRWLDPRRSLGVASGWLVLLLSLGLAGGVGFWAGELTRQDLQQQHAERAADAAERWSRGLDALLAQRRQPLQTAAAMLPLALRLHDTARLDTVMADLQHAYPELSSLLLADDAGHLVVATPRVGGTAGPPAWLRQGARQPWLGFDGHGARAGDAAAALLLALPVRDIDGRAVGVIGARLDWSWVLAGAAQLRERIPFLNEAHALLLDADHRVLIGPPALLGRQLPASDDMGLTRAPSDGNSLQAMGWTAGVRWPVAQATRQADSARRHIVVLALVLGGAAAGIGVLLARRLTRRLKALTDAVQTAQPQGGGAIAVPTGRDEASRLGRAFNALLASLQHERQALTELTTQLEQRVQARTREVERLAEETRYAAVTRERLRLARDLHDTLAHSMMAMLAEVRILKTLHRHDPAALGDELERAEATARDGLQEARAAIAQMRFNGVRDLGLGAALRAATGQFTDRTGTPLAFVADPQAANLADARAEALFRMAEEALRNIERHAMATQVQVTLADDSLDATDRGQGLRLAITDNGIGFDPAQRKAGHYGLLGLREQAQLIGATLAITSAPGQGCAVTIGLAVAT